jgi:hypothetical protein
MESMGGDKTPAAIAAYSEAVALCDDVLDTLRFSEIPERVEEAEKVQSLVRVALVVSYTTFCTKHLFLS